MAVEEDKKKDKKDKKDKEKSKDKDKEDKPKKDKSDKDKGDKKDKSEKSDKKDKKDKDSKKDGPSTSGAAAPRGPPPGRGPPPPKASGSSRPGNDYLAGVDLPSSEEEEDYVERGHVDEEATGGWRMRISLARALYIQPTLLLLDEPTNHLDLRAVLWLEEYLMRWKKTLIVVSHDRDFLNSVTTDIIHLHDNKLHQYRGNFAQFEEMYEQKRREVNKAFEKYEKQIKAAKSGGGKDAKAKAEKITTNATKTQAKRRGAAVDDGASASASSAPTRWSDYTVEFHFPEPTELAPPLIQLIDVDFKYPGR
ncbi:ABC transporter F family member 4 [Tetrabaena socialis]|uniref:ABC transporter F family member 4 n=1 Tax=Tetrabaena socialis TaxID=47790 RepID=A0A2J7ZIC9_9CHLO|nr:ABC transporter F family member 4 [Tetrabaena socialis]|eukprot:PNH00025.1 ABC transporter F family member 4 [Tetrabaena socialis]